MCKTNCNFEKFQKTSNMIYTVSTMWDIMLKTMLLIVGTVRITAVQISKKLKCAKQTAISKSLKTL